jgi:hypothetical protein
MNRHLAVVGCSEAPAENRGYLTAFSYRNVARWLTHLGQLLERDQSAIITMTMIRQDMSTHRFHVRLPAVPADRCDPRIEAIRRLVELGFKTTGRPVSKPAGGLRAQELATKAIERLSTPQHRRTNVTLQERHGCVFARMAVRHRPPNPSHPPKPRDRFPRDVAARSLLLSNGGCAWMGSISVGGSYLMKSTAPMWVWVTLVLAFLLIGYVVTPPVVIRQAAALWGWS